MTNTMTRILAATATLGLAFAPIAAQANTRAGDNAAVYGVSGPGLGREDEGEDFAAFAPLAIVAVVVTATVAAITTAVEQANDSDGDDGQSPGA